MNEIKASHYVIVLDEIENIKKNSVGLVRD